MTTQGSTSFDEHNSQGYAVETQIIEHHVPSISCRKTCKKQWEKSVSFVRCSNIPTNWSLQRNNNGELIASFYLMQKYAAYTVRFYSQNRKMRRCLCSVRNRNTIWWEILREMDTLDIDHGSAEIQPSVPVLVVAEVHYKIIAGPLHIVKNVAYR